MAVEGENFHDPSFSENQWCPVFFNELFWHRNDGRISRLKKKRHKSEETVLQDVANWR